MASNCCEISHKVACEIYLLQIQLYHLTGLHHCLCLQYSRDSVRDQQQLSQAEMDINVCCGCSLTTRTFTVDISSCTGLSLTSPPKTMVPTDFVIFLTKRHGTFIFGLLSSFLLHFCYFVLFYLFKMFMTLYHTSFFFFVQYMHLSVSMKLLYLVCFFFFCDCMCSKPVLSLQSMWWEKVHITSGLPSLQ